MSKTWAVAKTLVSEIAAPQHVSTAMGLTSGCWSLGLVVGPALGGMLANPATLYPKIFGESELLTTFPYLLPNLINSVMAIVSLFLVGKYLPETLPPETSADTIESSLRHESQIEKSSVSSLEIIL